MRRSSRFRKYRLALRALRAECPVDRPVRVRLEHRHRRHYGHCNPTRDGKGFTITVVAKRATANEMRDTIVHEWAHAMAWGAETDHGPEWGVAYARAYRATVED